MVNKFPIHNITKNKGLNMSILIKNLRTIFSLVFFLVFQNSAFAEIIIPFEKADKVDVSVETDVQFDAVSGLYTYNYTITSQSTSQQVNKE